MQRMRRHPMTFLLVAAIAVMTAACGGNDAGAGGGSPGASQPGAVGGETGAPGSAAASPAGQASGDLQVWAMGNEGELLSTMADAFMAENPDVNVEVTPIAWDQAVTKLQTAIGGRQTPGVSQMGTDMMGQFAATGALEPVPARLRPERRSSRAPGTRRRRRHRLRRAVVRRDPRALLAHRHRREGRHHRSRPRRGTSSRRPPRR